ncbi:MAG: DsrE family protein [Rhodocyclaceae bacterium]|nr:DsrE family protein [Rhodocyclaceae bacterium]
MKRRNLWVAAAAAALTLMAAPAAIAQTTGKLGVVVQVSDDNEKTWHQALNVVRNIQNEYGKDKVEVELVVFGNGVGLLKFDSPLANRIDDTLANGAQVLMCQNTMKARQLTPADMHAKIGYVKAGVVEIIEKQRQGWAVLRP